MMLEARNLLQSEVVQTQPEPSAAYMQTVQTLKLLPVWVDPAHLVASARILLQGHGLRALGVVSAGELVGTISIEQALASSDFLPVETVMEPVRVKVESDEPARQVAQRFVQENVDFAAVVREGRFLGIVTANMLLRELGRSWDPLTGLSWSDQLREWGIENLKRGSEVTILFLDLDRFGSYNKRFGHIVGDKVLRRMAAFLRENVEEGSDVLVRYGGDEFAIGTTRSRNEAEELAARLQRMAHTVTVPEADEAVGFCIGLFGGKRTKERESVHLAATLDNLINLASKDCLARKKRDEAESEADAAGEAQGAELHEPARATLPDVRVVNVFADETASNALTQVILRIGSNVVSGVSARMGRPAVESVASATGKALERAFKGASFKVGDINLSETREGQRMVSVAAQFSQAGEAAVSGGVAMVSGDLYTAVAEATVQAFLSAGPVA